MNLIATTNGPITAQAAGPPLTGVGTVWCGPRRLADVYYQLDGVQDLLPWDGTPVLRRPTGRLTLLLGDWWALLSMQEHGEELRLGDTQRLPFILVGGKRPVVWIRGLRDLELTGPAVPPPQVVESGGAAAT